MVNEDPDYQEKFNDMSKDLGVIYNKNVPMVITGKMPANMKKYGDSF